MELVADMASLARLHAALDSVQELEQLMAQVHGSPAIPPTSVRRVSALMSEARVLLGSLLARPEARQGVRNPVTGT
jgi:hypothetical protein